jgi:hypothetical protein
MTRRATAGTTDSALSWLCEGLATKDLIDGATVASVATLIEGQGFSRKAARAIARRVMRLRRPSANKSTYWAQVWEHINRTMDRDEEGNPTGWGLFGMHVHLAGAAARSALFHLGAPSEPGTYRKTPQGWSKVAQHDWRLEYVGIDENATVRVAAGVLSATLLLRQLLEKSDVGGALHLTFHLAELSQELALRMSGVREFIEIGVAVSEKGALDGALSPASERREQFWEAYERQYVGSAQTRPLRPTTFANKHFKEYGFPTASAAQKFLSRRLTGQRF